MTRRVLPIAALALLLFTACPSRSPRSSRATLNPATTGPASTLDTTKPGSTSQPQATAPGVSAPVRRPRSGKYVYDLVGRGTTKVPAGSQLTESVSSSGDAYTSDISNNKNSNTRRIRYKWETDKVLQTSVESTINGRTTKCTYQPPLEVLHLPIHTEKFPTQRWESNECSGQLEFEVFGQEEVDDATGRPWVTWRIEVRDASGRPVETRWFSAELGRDVRNQSISDVDGVTQQTETVLRSYPK